MTLRQRNACTTCGDLHWIYWEYAPPQPCPDCNLKGDGKP